MFLYSIPEGHAVVVEKFGKFDRVQTAGFNYLNPFTESIKRVDPWGHEANKCGYLIELSEQQTGTPVRFCQTADNVTIKANTSVYWKIIDPQKAVYHVDILTKSISDIALNALRSQIGLLKFDQVLASRSELNKRLLKDLSEILSDWGVELKRVELQELTYSDETAKAMMQEMVAIRKKRALVAEAEGTSTSELMLAESKAKAVMIEAQANADAMKLLAESDSYYLARLAEEVGEESACDILKAEKYNIGMKAITDNPSNKVFLPNSSMQAYAAA